MPAFEGKSQPHNNQGWSLSIINGIFIQIQIEISLKELSLTFVKITQMYCNQFYTQFSHPCPFLTFLRQFILSFSTFLSQYCDTAVNSMTRPVTLNLPQIVLHSSFNTGQQGTICRLVSLKTLLQVCIRAKWPIRSELIPVSVACSD